MIGLAATAAYLPESWMSAAGIPLATEIFDGVLGDREPQIGVLAAGFPARRAASIDPASTLRYE